MISSTASHLAATPVKSMKKTTSKRTIESKKVDALRSIPMAKTQPHKPLPDPNSKVMKGYKRPPSSK